MIMPSSSTPTIRFEYGRHETFTIRHGWLGKGVTRLATSEGFEADSTTADALGLGSRMVKSLGYWLEATGIATSDGRGRSRALGLSDMGGLIRKRDVFFEYSATWWFVHMTLATREGSVFCWFFNDYPERVFDRAACVAAYLLHVKTHASKAPTPTTGQRDVACLLASYSSDPAEVDDPENGAVCPLNELRLITHHRDTQRFEKSHPLDDIPIEVFIAACARAGGEHGEETLTLEDLASRRHGPGRLLGMTVSMIDAAATEAAERYAHEGVTYTLLGAERRLRVPRVPVHEWLGRHYDRLGMRA